MTSDQLRPHSAEEIKHWLVETLRRHLPPGEDDIRTDEPIVAHGIDSMQFVMIVGELEEWLGYRFSDNPLLDHPTIDSLAEFLAPLSSDDRPTAENVHDSDLPPA